MAGKRKKLKGTKSCKKQPKVQVKRYDRCVKGTALRRNTTAERKQKACMRGAPHEDVGGHKRKVCKAA